MTSRQHTYSVAFDDSRMWVDAIHFSRTACTHGVASGMGHNTLESAIHHEADHICGGTRPVWDGEIISFPEGLPVYIDDMPVTDRDFALRTLRTMAAAR